MPSLRERLLERVRVEHLAHTSSVSETVPLAFLTSVKAVVWTCPPCERGAEPPARTLARPSADAAAAAAPGQADSGPPAAGAGGRGPWP